MLGRAVWLVATLAVLSTSQVLIAEDKPDDLAKEVVGQFMKALRGNNLEAVLEAADVPWFHDGKKIIKDRDELKKEFKELLDKKDLKALKFEIKRVVPYKDVRDQTNEEEQKLLDEVLDRSKDDRVLLVEIDGKERVALMVRVREGRAVLVGLRD